MLKLNGSRQTSPVGHNICNICGEKEGNTFVDAYCGNSDGHKKLLGVGRKVSKDMLYRRISLGLRPSDEHEHTAKGSLLLQFPAFSSHHHHQGIKKSKSNKKMHFK